MYIINILKPCIEVKGSISVTQYFFKSVSQYDNWKIKMLKHLGIWSRRIKNLKLAWATQWDSCLKNSEGKKVSMDNSSNSWLFPALLISFNRHLNPPYIFTGSKEMSQNNLSIPTHPPHLFKALESNFPHTCNPCTQYYQVFNMHHASSLPILESCKLVLFWSHFTNRKIKAQR